MLPFSACNSLNDNSNVASNATKNTTVSSLNTSESSTKPKTTTDKNEESEFIPGDSPPQYRIPEGYGVMYYVSAPASSIFPIYDSDQYYVSPDFIPQESITITLGEITYTGTYDSMRSLRNESHIRYGNPDDNYTLDLNEKGELISISTFSSCYPSINAEFQGEISQEICEEKAKDFLSLISNSSNYRMVSVRKEGSISDDYFRYRIEFRKYFGEVPAYDTAAVYVRCDGYIETFVSTHFGRIPDDLDIPPINMDEVYSAINYTLNTVLGGLAHQADITDGPALFLMSDGEVALIFEYTFYDGDPDDPLCFGEYLENQVIIKIPQT